MKQNGVTTDGLSVMSGMFKYAGTHGIPLDFILMHLKKNNQVMDWIDYIKGALKDGHKPKNIKAKILSAVGDIYGPIYRNEIEKRLNIILPV